MLVEKSLNIKEKNDEYDANVFQIDKMVYKLYELTYDEVKVIDPAFALSKEAYESMELE